MGQMPSTPSLSILACVCAAACADIMSFVARTLLSFVNQVRWITTPPNTDDLVERLRTNHSLEMEATVSLIRARGINVCSIIPIVEYL